MINFIKIFTILLLNFVVITFKISLYSQCNASLSPTLLLTNVNGFHIPFQNGIPLPTFEKQDRMIINLSGSWKHQRFISNHSFSLQDRDKGGLENIEKESEGKYKTDYDDSKWELIDIPGVENKMHFHNDAPEIHYDGNPSGFNGGVWYRKQFMISPSDQKEFYKLMFYSVNYICDVWLNGKYIGYHEGGYTPFAFDITDFLNKNGFNILTIRVDNPPILDPSHPWKFIRNDVIPCHPAIDFFNYTGIVHDIYIERTSSISVFRADVVPLDINGTIKNTITLYNKSKTVQNINVCLEVYEANINSNNWTTEKASDLILQSDAPIVKSCTKLYISGNTASAFQTNLSIPNPKLWFPSKNINHFSNLYILKVKLIDSLTGNILDNYYTQFGLRTIINQNHRLYINDKVSFLTGTARIEDHPDRGRSVTKEIISDDLLKIRNTLHCNWLRTANFPNDLYTYLIADRLGIAIMEDIPLFWFDKNSWDCQTLRQLHTQMFREMIFKDYNRPSVFLWCISEENPVINPDPRIPFLINLKNEINEYYPDGRFIGQSATSCNNYFPNCGEDLSQSYCDIATWTMYTPCGDTNQCQESLNEFLDKAHNYFPNKSFMATEYGASYNTDYINNRLSSFIPRASLKNDGTVNCDGFISAITYWTAFDFYSTSNLDNSDAMGHINVQGLCDSNRKAKPHSSIITNLYLPFFELGGIYDSFTNPCK